MRALWLTAVFALILSWNLPALAQVPEGRGEIIYVNGSTIYINAGRAAGLRIGQQVDVFREEGLLGRLRVDNLAQARASCSPLDSTVVYAVGDRVVFAIEPEAEEVLTQTLPESRTKEKGKEPGGDLRGRVGAQVLSLSSPGGGDYTQPALSLRLDGTNLGGSGVDAHVDMRTRRTFRTVNQVSSTRDLTRIYRMALSRYNHSGHLRLAVGRQSSTDLASISIFDGFLMEYSKGSMRAGAFAGWQPDDTFGFSTNIMEMGAFAGLQKRTGPTRTTAATGWVTSLHNGHANRDYVFLRLMRAGPKMQVFAHQEIDFRRSWDSENQKDAISLSNTLLSVRYSAASWLTLRSGFNSRKNVRLYRDRETPETEFDDRYRRGINAGAEVAATPLWKFGLTGRTRLGETGNGSRSLTATVRCTELGKSGLGGSLRSTWFSTDTLTGNFQSATVSRDLSRRLRLEVHGGLRREHSSSLLQAMDRTAWYGADMSLGLSRGMFFLLNLDRTEGDTEKSTQAFSSLSYRF